VDIELQKLLDELRDQMAGMSDRQIADQIIPALFDGKYEFAQEWRGKELDEFVRISLYPERI